MGEGVTGDGLAVLPYFAAANRYHASIWMSKQKSDRGFANANRRLNRLTGAMGEPAVIVMEPLK